MKTLTKLWLFIVVLIILTPIGLIIPERFKAGSAWGEWGAEEIQEVVGYVPQGLAKLSSLWNAPIPDYAFRGWEGRPMAAISFAYIISAIAGIGITVGAVLLIGRFLGKKDDRDATK